MSVVNKIRKERYSINVYYITFPGNGSIRGASRRNRDGSFDIFIHKELSEAERLKTFLHEASHIFRGDLDGGKNVDEIEAETHETPDELTE